MGRSSRHKEKHDKNGQLSQDNCNEGTAARTRPFSFDEIMLSRENKKLSESVKEEPLEAGKALGDSIVENVSDRRESERGYRHNRDSSHGVRRLSSEVYLKVSKNKEENTSMKKDKLAKQKSRESHALETKLKVEMKKDMSTKVKGMTDVQTHSRRKINERSSNDFENEAEKKHSRGFIEKGRPTDGSSGKSERESKRKYQNGDDKKNKDSKASKKHDLVKGHDVEIPERKERKQSSKFRLDHITVKRRRSRSRDREENRNIRSISLSPRSHTRTSYHGREHGELSSHTLKFRSERHHFDTGRSRIESNVSSSHSRRYSGSTSGLGGYSPRKRRAEAAIKTPSPTIRSPEKKIAKWDLTPAGTGGIFSGSVSSDFQPATQTASSNVLEVANTVKPLAGISYSALSTKQNASFESVQLIQATQHTRRLYVENVPASVSEKAMIECFNNLLLSSGYNHIQGTEPCISCIIQKEKNQAFVEFLTLEDASAALSFDGCSFAGSILKIKRPKDFVEVTTGELEKLEASADAINDTVKDSPHKIFVGGISKALSSEMIVEIASAFGPLKAYHFEINEDLKEPCAFLEYVDQSVTLKACAGLNGMKLGGQIMTAVQAFPNATFMEISGKPPFYGIPEHAKQLLNKPTQVLKLRNVFNPEGLSSLSEHEVEEILEDVRLECARFGAVKSVNVVKHGISHITTSESCEVADIKGAGSDDTKAEMEALEVLNHPSGEINGLDIPSNANKDKEVNKDVEGEGNNITGDGLTVDPVEDDLRQPCTSTAMVDPVEDELGQPCTNMAVEELAHESVFEAISAEVPEPLSTSKVEPDCHDEKVVLMEDVGVENKTAEKELNSEDITGTLQEDFAVSDGGDRIHSDLIKKVDNKEHECNPERVFEPGCVFVEYGRTEASSIAAGCLHGRLFDNQIVTVEYVPLDLYRARFS